MFILDQQNSIANQYLSELRDTHIQNDRLRFRKNLFRLGEIMAYEVSRKLSYVKKETSTPLGTYHSRIPEDDPVLITVLRAGMPFYQGFLEFFDHSDSGFIGAFRATEGEESQIEVETNYQALPLLTGRNVVLIDPMLATGKSVMGAIEEIKQKGMPNHIYIVAVISAPEGIEYIQSNLDIDCSIWTASLDEHLNNKAYIVPGLGDAGDLAFGPKH